MFGSDGINEAIRICTEHPEPIQLLTDIVMPGMSGSSLCKLKGNTNRDESLFASGYSEDAVLMASCWGTEFIQNRLT
jgi:CheY-like chemotaxis protein